MGVVVTAALLAWGYPESPRFTTSEPPVSLLPKPWLLTLPGAPARALELAGSTVFVRAPWQVDLVSYNTTVGQPLPEYYFTLNLDHEAGASLAGFTFQQIRGVDRQFPFLVERTRAFLGRPRREGRPVPVKARFNNDTRTMTLEWQHRDRVGGALDQSDPIRHLSLPGGGLPGWSGSSGKPCGGGHTEDLREHLLVNSSW
jgi:hypothetical protein